MIDVVTRKKLRSYLSDSDIDLLEEIESRKETTEYFLSKTDKLKWLFPLKILGYLDVVNAPGPKLEDEKNRLYFIPKWEIMPYLVNVASKLKESANKEYRKVIYEFIYALSEERNKQGDALDNYRIFYSIIQILNELPSTLIPQKLIKCLPVWLNSKFGVELPGSELIGKFIPKFLPPNASPSDTKKLTLLLEYVTRLRWEKAKPSYYDSGKQPKLENTYWLFKLLVDEGFAFRLGKQGLSNILTIFSQRLKEVFRRERPKHFVEFEYNKEVYVLFVRHSSEFSFRVKIGKIGEDKIEDAQPFRLTEYAKIATIISEFKIDGAKNYPEFENILVQNIRNFDQGFKQSSEVLNAIRELYSNIYYDGSYIWCRTIREGSEHKSHDPDEFFTLVIRDVILGIVEANPDSMKKIVDEYTSGVYDYPVFKRLLLHVFGSNWVAFRLIFWTFLEKVGEEVLFADSHYKAELYTLLEENIQNFTNPEKTKLERIILEGSKHFLKNDLSENARAFWRQRWYHALQSDPRFARLLDRERNQTNQDVELDFRGSSVRMGPGPSPLSSDEMLKMSNGELAKFINGFKEVDSWRGPTEDGLSSKFEQAVFNNPTKFIKNLRPFLSLRFDHATDLLRGIEKASGQIDINWVLVFEFIQEYIDREVFIGEQLRTRDASQSWILGATGELISTSVKSDTKKYSKDHIQYAKSLVALLVKHITKSTEWEDNDPLFRALNSTSGKLCRAIIALSIRISKLDKGHKEKSAARESIWDPDLLKAYSTLLKGSFPEAFTLLGWRMSAFAYLDWSWLKLRVEEFIELSSRPLWIAFISGYLASNRVYDDLYRLMSKHYKKAFEEGIPNIQNKDLLAEHISIGYLRGHEGISGSGLFARLLDSANIEQLEGVIGFFWGQREFLIGEGSDSRVVTDPNILNIIERILAFWKELHNRYSAKAAVSEDESKLIGSLSKLAVYLDQIDSENSKMLTLCSEHVGNQRRFDFPFFIEYLDKLKDKGDPVIAGITICTVFQTMLDSFTPDFDQKHIRSIFKHLYQLNNPDITETANTLVNSYRLRGKTFLLDIYNEYN